MVNNSSKNKIPLPKTAITITHSPRDGTYPANSSMSDNKRVGSALTTDRAGSYIK